MLSLFQVQRPKGLCCSTSVRRLGFSNPTVTVGNEIFLIGARTMINSKRRSRSDHNDSPGALKKDSRFGKYYKMKSVGLYLKEPFAMS